MRSLLKYLISLTAILLLCHSCQGRNDATLTQSPGNLAESGNEAMEISTNKLGTALINRGDVYRKLGRNEEALKSYQRALVIINEAIEISSNKTGLGDALINRGDVYHKLGRNEEALKSYQQALAIFEELGDTPATEDTNNKIKRLHQ